MFGVVAVAPALTGLTWQTVAYAVLSLTVIRMLPVAVALGRARLGRLAVVFVGWFGPRGLASVVFGLLALEDLAEPAAKPAVTVIAFTVLLSVLAHGLSAGPLASRYGPRLTPPPGAAGLAEVPERCLIRRTPAAAWPKEREIAYEHRSDIAEGQKAPPGGLPCGRVRVWFRSRLACRTAHYVRGTQRTLRCGSA